MGKVLAPLGSEVLGNHNPRAGGYSDKQNKQKKKQGRCAAHSRQGVVADVMTDNDGVNSTVQLLNDVSNKHWHSKDKQVFPRLAFCHIS
jgi:hypothetical protein